MRGKFQRTYRLDIFTPQGKLVTIEPPFTMRANVIRNTLASANRGTIEVINMPRSIRNQIYKDRFSIPEYWEIRLMAGYNNRLHEIFLGNAYEIYHNKPAGPEWISTIDCFDGLHAIQNGFTSITVEKNTPKPNYIRQVANNMQNIVLGALGTPAQGQSPRGKVLIGQSSEIIKQETGNKYFIDNEVLNILSNDEVLSGPVIRLDSDDLLSTPRRRQTFLDVHVLFEPQVRVGHRYQIDSLESRYNGQYKIVGFSHNIEISGARAGSATTMLSLSYFPGFSVVANS